MVLGIVEYDFKFIEPTPTLNFEVLLNIKATKFFWFIQWPDGSKNFQEHLDCFISEQNSRFQVVFDLLHTNQYLIDWYEVIDKKRFV